MIEIVNTGDKLTAIEGVWRQLETNPRMRIFQTYEWCTAAWTEVLDRTKGNLLWVVKWGEGENSVILPTYIDPHGTLRFILDDDSDIGDAVYAEGYNHHIAFREIAEAILKEPKIRRVHLKKLYGESEALNYLSILLRPTVVYKDNGFSWIDVEPSADFVAAQKHMKSKDRADLKNVRKKSEKYRLRVATKNGGDDFPEAAMRDLRDKMRAVEKRAGDYFPDEDINFVRRLYETGACEVAVLEDESGLQALNVILVKGSRRLSWVFFYADPRTSTGLYINYFCQHVQSEPYVFDFGVGVYSYKIGTFRPMLGMTSSLCYGKGLVSWLKMLVAGNLRYLKDYIKASR